MDKNNILLTIKSFLSDEFNCNAADLENCNVTFTINYLCKFPYIKIMAFDQSIIVSTSAQLSSKVKYLLTERNRDEIFEFPFVYGHTIHYVPDINKMCKMPLIDEYTYELMQGNDVRKLMGITGFDNSLSFDSDGNTPTTIVFCAKKDDEIIGLAGASIEAKSIWEVGVDVKNEYRKNGLGTRLVNNLTIEILKQEIVPIYSSSITNISSQMVATRSGYIPCWIDTYGNILDGSSPYNSLIKKLVL